MILLRPTTTAQPVPMRIGTRNFTGLGKLFDVGVPRHGLRLGRGRNWYFQARISADRVDSEVAPVYVAGQSIEASRLVARNRDKGRLDDESSRPLPSGHVRPKLVKRTSLGDFERLMFGHYSAAMSLDEFQDLMQDSDASGVPDDQVLVEALAEDQDRLRRVVSGLRGKVPDALIKELARPKLKYRARDSRMRDQGYAMAYEILRLNGVHKYYLDFADKTEAEPRRLARDLSLALDRALDFLAQIGYANPTDRLNALNRLLRLLAPELSDHFPRGGHGPSLLRYNRLAVATFAQFKRVLERRGIKSPYQYTVALDAEV